MEIAVRDLKPGMAIRVGPAWLSVISSGFMDGRNGETPTMIAGGRKSAFAVKIEVEGRDPIIAHPAETVEVQGP